MLQHEFHLKIYNDFLLPKKSIKYFPFSYLFFKQKKKDSSRRVYLNVFNHIVTFCKNYVQFLGIMSAITMFRKSSFIFNFVGYGYRLMTKSLEVRWTFEEVAEKTKCQNMNLNLFTTKLGWIISSTF
jgi:hypothetical protein